MSDNAATYHRIQAELAALWAGERDFIANMANCAAILYHSLPNINWAGFYLLKQNDLVLGPFQGQPACIRIGLGRGVCGTAAMRRETIVVPDVHKFPGHIACDAASQSEIVVPLIRAGQLLGVLDVDSPLMSRFDESDAAGLIAVAALLIERSDC